MWFVPNDADINSTVIQLPCSDGLIAGLKKFFKIFNTLNQKAALFMNDTKLSLNKVTSFIVYTNVICTIRIDIHLQI